MTDLDLLDRVDAHETDHTNVIPLNTYGFWIKGYKALSDMVENDNKVRRKGGAV